MDIVAGHTALQRRLHEPALAIGNFDGVHRGHQQLFAETRRRAAARGGTAAVLTFHPHPARILNPRYAPPLIATEERKLELVAAAGIDVCIVEPFTPELARLEPATFVDRVLVSAIGAREVVIGYDFTFGRGRAGDAKLLAALGADPARGFAVHVVEPVTVEGMACSSTKVREFVLEGRVDGAALLLGRDPEVEGEVVSGAGRGRTIGVPTANLRPATELVPAPGVYAGWARVRGDAGRARRAYAAAINIGTNPTFGGGAVSIEAHLLDWPGDSLLGARLLLGFRKRLRAEARFPSTEALVEQIRRDIEATRALGAAPSGEA